MHHDQWAEAIGLRTLLVVYMIYDLLYLVINLMGGFQTLRSCHPSFLLSQMIESSQCILDVSLPHHLLQIFL